MPLQRNEFLPQDLVTVYTSPSGLIDTRTGYAYVMGGLIVGGYFDLTEQEAQTYGRNQLHSGRYRFVQVDSGATASNVKTGTVGYLRAGTSVKSVVITAAGSGQTAGTYTIAASPASGGGVNAVIQVVVGAAGTITSATVLQGGTNYVSAPTFYVVAGGTPGTVAAQLGTTPNLVTSLDQAIVGITGVPLRPVVFLNSITPGNYGFIQELGTATVLGNVTMAQSTPGSYCNAISGNGGTITTTASSGSPIGTTVGVAIDVPLASNLFKMEFCYVPVVQD